MKATFEREAEKIERLTGATVDRLAFDAYLTDGLTDAFAEPRKALERQADGLAERMWVQQLADERADYFASAAE